MKKLNELKKDDVLYAIYEMTVTKIRFISLNEDIGFFETEDGRTVYIDKDHYELCFKTYEEAMFNLFVFSFKIFRQNSEFIEDEEIRKHIQCIDNRIELFSKYNLSVV